MEKAIAILRLYKDTMQNLHWLNAKNYAKHLLFERLMNDVGPLLDRMVEVYLGANDRTINIEEIKYEESSDLTLREFIEKCKTDFKACFLVGVDDDMENVVSDILEMFDRHLYLC